MAAPQNTDKGPDLSLGLALSAIPANGLLQGHVGDEDVLLVKSGDELFAVGASCPHYHAPLVDGLVHGDTLRCPWHHARFSLRTGEAVRAPAFDPIACWQVEQRDDKVFVTRKKPAAPRRASRPVPRGPSRIVVVGGGAAGFAAAEMLRREGYEGRLTMLSADDAAPVDRPNLSKDYLAGSAQEDWLPLRPDTWYRDNDVELRLGAEVVGLNSRSSEVQLKDGTRVGYDRVLLAPGAEPVRLTVPGSELPHVHTLRSLNDCRAIIAAAERGRRAVVIGASFIGLEVAASLRTRGIEVHVVGPEQRPLEKVFGAELGDFIRSLHEERGVVFHLGQKVAAIEPQQVRLESGARLAADVVVVGIGVQPRTAIAERAGLKLDRGIVVDAYLQTSAPGVFAAGDVARWPDRRSSEALRVEHWVVAERQGQVAARNMLGRPERYDDVPFFWSMHYDLPILYVGHASRWDRVEIDGDPQARDCAVRYISQGRVQAIASISRDVEALTEEVAMERSPAAGTPELAPSAA